MTVTDASPLIALDRIGRLDLIVSVAAPVLVPPAVVAEFGRCPDGMEERAVQNVALVRALRGRVDAGEAEAIALATEVSRAVLLDERRARQVALEIGVPVLGVVGLLLRAKRAGLLPEVKPLLEALVAASFRVSDSLIDDALRRAGEGRP